MIQLSEFEKYSAEKIYQEAFQRFMLPYPDKRLGEYLGNDQRLLFAPYLMKIFGKCRPCKVLDLGAGSGETVDLALRHVDQIELYIEEPNKLLLEKYQERIKQYPHIKLMSQFNGPAQDLVNSLEGKEWLGSLPSINVILMIHMAYYIDTKYLKPFFEAIFEKLEKGGHIFLVFAEQPLCTTARAAKNYFTQSEPELAQKMEANWNLRMQLFEQGGLVKSEITCHKTPSRMYGKNIEELALMCFIGELSMSSSPFLARYESALKYIQEHAKELELRQETSGPRTGLWSTLQPQLVYEIHKV